ncbi:32161_t:CDS:2, partial [Racocetra persica]
MTDCPNCKQQLDIAGWCKICEEYYYGDCPICKTKRTGELWCQHCESRAYRKNFRKWTSGNKHIDSLIQQSQINAKENYQVWEWIPYTQFTNIRYLDKGGFSTVMLATWLDGPRDIFNRDTQSVERRPNEEVILKILHQSQNINAEFLKEALLRKFLNIQLRSNYACRLAGVGWILGITKEPNTNEFVMVIRYYEKGDFRKFLRQNAENLTWRERLLMLHYVASALIEIHEAGFIHRDLHPGNIYQRYNTRYNVHVSYVGDLGLCTPANESPKSSRRYGVVPYVAPEILRGGVYTDKSDIYSFGIIMAELASGNAPFSNLKHDHYLVREILKGARPEFPDETPKCYVDLMKRCWDGNPLNRPTAKLLLSELNKWIKFYKPESLPLKTLNTELSFQNESNNECKQFYEADISHHNLPSYNFSKELYKSKDITTLVENVESNNFELCEANNLQENRSNDELWVSTDITYISNK